MTCPHCQSTAIRRRKQRTALGYRRFSCASCQQRFNERTGTPFNELQFPTDIVLLAVLWRLRYKLGLRDVAELLLQRGYDVSYETVRAWEFRFAPLISAELRTRRRGHGGRSWYLDETYVKVSGRWCYLYRATDRDGQLLDSMLSEHRDRSAARRFLRRLVEVSGRRPLRVTTDHHGSYPRAIRWRSAGDPLDLWSKGNSSTRSVSEQPDGTIASSAETAVLPDAGVRELRISVPVLYSVRRGPQLLQNRQGSVIAGTARVVHVPLAGIDREPQRRVTGGMNRAGIGR